MDETKPRVEGTMRITIRDGKPGVQVTDPAGNSLFMDGESAFVIDPSGHHLAQLPMHNGRLEASANVSPEFAASLERIEHDQQAASGGSIFRKMIYAAQVATTGISVDMREGDIAALAHASTKEAPARRAETPEPEAAARPTAEALAAQFRQDQAQAAAPTERPHIRGIESSAVWQSLSPADREKMEAATLAVLNAPLPQHQAQPAHAPTAPAQGRDDSDLWRTLGEPGHEIRPSSRPADHTDQVQPDHGLNGLRTAEKRQTSPASFRS